VRRAAVRSAVVVGLAVLGLVAVACVPATGAPAKSVPPAGVTAPVISGTAQVGSTLSTTAGGWSGKPTGFATQWQSCSAATPTSCTVVGADAADYVVTASDVGRLIQVRVTASNDLGAAAQLSTAVGPVVSSGPVETSRAGVWTATGTRQTCALFGSSWTCGTSSKVTLGFSLAGVCDGVGSCRLSALSGNWGWSLSGGSTCVTIMGGGAYQVASGTATATFTLAADQTIGVQAVVPQSPLPPTMVITDLRAIRIGDAPADPLGCA
jgi:hypothetical protein